MDKIALITGATSGIGEATARYLAEAGYSLIITGRRQERLLNLSSRLKENGVHVLPLCFDVRDKEAVYKALGNLPVDWQNIDVLINNAGLAAGLSDLENADENDWDRMIDTNVKGLLYVSKAIIPLMKAREKGYIVNISSIAGREAYSKGNVYCASKHAVQALTQTMRIDLLPFQIRVTSICPGATETEFSLVRFNGDEDKAKQVYKGYTPLTAEDVADLIRYIVTRPAHVSISDVLITPSAQASTAHFYKTEN
ncbi:MAG: SDR family NAD(P)-dependent oxidoreductase [Flavobacteriales bacterium]